MPDKGTKYLVTKDKQSKFKDDVYLKMTSQIEEIRSSVSMYVSPLGTAGALHLLKEIINNAIDEAMNPLSVVNDRIIYVTFDEKAFHFTVTDSGRGIPLDFLVEAVSEKHVGTKTKGKVNRNKDLAGMNGVGLTVVAALSDYMSITSYRGDKYKMIEFKDGELNEHEVKKATKERYGTSVVIFPSEKYLGEIELTCDIVEDYLRHMSYILRGGIKICYAGIPSKGKKNHEITYERAGLAANVQFLSPSLEFPPICIETENDDFGLEIAFSYDMTLDETLCDSYTNYIITTEGGVHEQVAQRAICEFISRKAKELEPNQKIEVTYDDCRKGLVFAVNCRHVSPILEGQHKSRFSSPDVLKNGRYLINRELTNYFHENPGTLRKIITMMRTIAKARMESNKIKGVATSKKPMTLMEDAEIESFYQLSDRYYKGYKELYICEGESAGGALANCRNAKFQAIYGIRGVTDNVWGMTLTQMMKADVFNKLTRILGCGVGKDFDISKLRYNKIIICTDSDSDGLNITSLLLCYFMVFMPELITQGKIYKAMPPLYLLKAKSFKKFYKGREWIYDKNEMYQMLSTIISNNVDIAIDKVGGKKNEILPLKKKDALAWLMSNSEYLLELNNLAKRSFCHPTIVEYVVYYKLLTDGNEMKFKKLVEKQFPEMTYNLQDQSLSGGWELQQYSLICDRLFMKSANRFINVYQHNPSIFVYSKTPNESRHKKSTIGEFMRDMGMQYAIKAEQRFKGLGEANVDLLFMTTMNPRTRKLLRMTMPDPKAAHETFQLLHEKSKTMIEARRLLLYNATISYADIDN